MNRIKKQFPDRFVGWMKGTVSVAFLTFVVRPLFIKLWRKAMKRPDGPLGFPYLGSMPYMSSSSSMVNFYINILPQYGDIAQINIGMQTIFVVNNPLVLKQLFHDSTKKVISKASVAKYRSFVSTNNDVWSQRSKIIQSKLMAMLNTKFIENGADKFLNDVIFPDIDKELKIESESQKIDIGKYITPISFNTIFYACFGETIQSINDKLYLELKNEFKTFLSKIVKGAFMKMFLGEFIYWHLLSNDKIENLPEYTMVESVKKYIRMNKNRLLLLNTGNDDNHIPFYASMINSNFSDEMIDQLYGGDFENGLCHDITILLFGGTDTLSSTLTTIIYNLCQYPNIQENIYDEIKSTFSSDDSDDGNDIHLSKDKLNKLNIFRAFIYETMRVYPVSIGTDMHYLDKDRIIKDSTNGKIYYLKKDCKIQPNAIYINKTLPSQTQDNNSNSSNNNNNEFNLNNWLKHDKFSYNNLSPVFGYGKRMCTGKTFARKQILIILTRLMLKYKFINENIQVTMDGMGIRKPIQQHVEVVARYID